MCLSGTGCVITRCVKAFLASRSPFLTTTQGRAAAEGQAPCYSGRKCPMKRPLSWWHCTARAVASGPLCLRLWSTVHVPVFHSGHCWFRPEASHADHRVLRIHRRAAAADVLRGGLSGTIVVLPRPREAHRWAFASHCLQLCNRTPRPMFSGDDVTRSQAPPCFTLFPGPRGAG